MSSQPSRITEAEIGLAVLQILAAEPNGSAEVENIKDKVPRYVKLSTLDRVQSLTRPNEEVWEQQVRNLVSHKITPGNIFAEGLAHIPSKGVWSITDAGRLYLRNKGLT